MGLSCMSKILLLKDDESLNIGISFKLKKEGYDVISTGSIKQGLEKFYSNNINLIVSDVRL